MTIGEYLRALLVGDPAVGAQVAARVYSEVLPQKPVTPAVVFTAVSGDEDATLDGQGGVATVRMQVDAWATTRKAATKLAIAVKTLLHEHTGGAAGLEVQGIFVTTAPRWDFDDATGLYRTGQDFECWFSGESAG
jgi:hypothetical protein